VEWAVKESIPQGLKPLIFGVDLRDPRLKPWATQMQQQKAETNSKKQIPFGDDN
jgi:hypothetical protein